MSGPIVWSEAALQLFALDRPTAVSAGAGSGKTTCLVELCLRLFAGEATGTPCEPHQLVAITFTEKAAAELEERLREGLARRQREAWEAGDAAAAGRWRACADALPGMALGTIHAFAARLLREHALEAGVDPAFQVLDEETAQAWRGDAALAAVVEALDLGQLEVQVLAAAGSAEGLAAAVAGLVRERATLGDTAPLRPAPDRMEEARAARGRLLDAAATLLAGRSSVRTTSGTAAMERLAQALAAFSAQGPREVASPSPLPSPPPGAREDHDPLPPPGRERARAGEFEGSLPLPGRERVGGEGRRAERARRRSRVCRRRPQLARRAHRW